MQLYNMHQAKTQLSKLVQLANQGEVIFIGKSGKPTAQLIAYKEPLIDRKPGMWKGKIWMAEDFDETPKEIVDAFYNSKIFPDE